MGTYKRWSSTELEFIKNNLSTFSDVELASKLSQMTGENISYGMIRRQRRKIGVVKARGRRKKITDINSLN